MEEHSPGERLSQFGRINGDYTIPTKTKHKILICECGNRYLKTRRAHQACLRCVAYELMH